MDLDTATGVQIDTEIARLLIVRAELTHRRDLLRALAVRYGEHEPQTSAYRHAGLRMIFSQHVEAGAKLIEVDEELRVLRAHAPK